MSSACTKASPGRARLAYAKDSLVAGPGGNGIVMASTTAPTEALPVSPVLCLSIGQSGLRRLVELAALEGIDASTLATNLLMYELGQRVMYARARLATQQVPDDAPNTPVGVVCLACGRSRTDPRHTRCPACH